MSPELLRIDTAPIEAPAPDRSRRRRPFYATDATPTALRLVPPPRRSRLLALWLAWLLVVTFIALIFVPWRQSVSGHGRVIAYHPIDRRFDVEAPIYGRVREWHVIEGTRVAAGQLLARISDNDSDFLQSLKLQREATLEKVETATTEVTLNDAITERFLEVRQQAIGAAESQVEVADQKVKAAEQEVAAAKVGVETNKLQFERLSRLYPQGLASRREGELAEQKYREGLASLQRVQADLSGAKADKTAKLANLEEVKAKTNAEVSKSRTEVQKARGKLAEARKELQDTEVKIRRQQTQEVHAPRAGVIMRILVNAGTEQVYPGDPIATLVPDAGQLAAVLYVSGNDQPLIHRNDPVRLQFEGWPAVQFVGWPSVAVGTFGGRVAFVDPAETSPGKFRVVVLPDTGQGSWPSERYLRQGVRVGGWVLLRRVALGYEIWRRLNGFPPVIAKEEPGGIGTEPDRVPKGKGLKIKPRRAK